MAKTVIGRICNAKLNAIVAHLMFWAEPIRDRIAGLPTVSEVLRYPPIFKAVYAIPRLVDKIEDRQSILKELLADQAREDAFHAAFRDFRTCLAPPASEKTRSLANMYLRALELCIVIRMKRGDIRWKDRVELYRIYEDMNQLLRLAEHISRIMLQARLGNPPEDPYAALGLLFLHP